ncbi:MAG: alcohol dehydrogenase [Clostridium sp.]|jgi:alcohol dehydrogenase
MAYAQFLGGMAFNKASLGYVHAMAHQLGGFYNLPHGVCNAVLLPIVSRFNILASADRFKDIAIAMGENVTGLSVHDAALVAIKSIETLSQCVGIPRGLTELGVKEEDFEVMATNAKADACQFTNPRLATLEKVIELFRQAL